MLKRKRLILTEQLETVWGIRVRCVVKYPALLSVSEMLGMLWWAKSWDCLSFYDPVVFVVYVKPNYIKQFKKVNKKYMARFYEERLADTDYIAVKDERGITMYQI